MMCPTCNSEQACKNGYRKGVQSYRCKGCGRQFLESYQKPRYSDATKRRCLKLYFDGMGVKAIERATHVHHTTVLHWIRQVNLNAFSLEPLLEPKFTTEQLTIDRTSLPIK